MFDFNVCGYVLILLLIIPFVLFYLGFLNNIFHFCESLCNFVKKRCVPKYLKFITS